SKSESPFLHQLKDRVVLLAGSLRDECDVGNEARHDQRRDQPAQVQPGLDDGLAEKVSEGSAERLSQDERGQNSTVCEIFVQK
ncbi:MAG: hypothetical protein ABI364_03340, partial [Caldimonas sp.]